MVSQNSWVFPVLGLDKWGDDDGGGVEIWFQERIQQETGKIIDS